MTRIQIFLVTFTDKKNSSLPPFPDGLNFVHYDGEKVFLNFDARWGHAFGFKIFIKVMNLMQHLSFIS